MAYLKSNSPLLLRRKKNEMKKVKFGIQVAILMLAFPLLFLVGITHATGSPPKEREPETFEVVKAILSEEEFVFTNSYTSCPRLFN